MPNGAHSDAGTTQVLELGPWTIDASARQVAGPHGTARLEPKAMGVLVELASRPGEVIARQRLLERVWGAEMATDDVLSRAISELRRALGDDTRNPQFVITVRGSGYRLVVPDVARASNSVGAAERQARDARVAGARSRVAPTAGIVAGIAATLSLVVALRSAEPDRATAPDLLVTPLTSLPGQESAPRLSPDGTRIAYAWRDDARQTQQVYVRLVDGGQELRVTSGSGDYHLSAWSPDGSRLAVTRTDDRALGIYEVPSLGGTERLMASVSGPYILGLDWSSDGRRIVYAALDSAATSFGVRVHDVTSHAEQRLTTGARDAFGDVYPAFSPDGGLVAFVRFFSETAADVFVVPSSGGTVRRLTTDERAIGSVAFDPDGRSILYSANRDGRTAVWRVAVDGSDQSSPTKVYESARGIAGIAPLRAGRGIVVAESDQDLNLWAAPIDRSQAPRQLAPSTRIDALPRYSPDGGRVAFVSDRSGASELWVADTAGASPAQLTRLGAIRGTPAWSPNGESIAVERDAGVRSELWIVDPARRTASRVPLSLRNALAPAWAPDGRSIFVSSREHGQWDVFRVSLDDGAVERITTAGAMAARPTAGGRAIVYVKPYTRGLWRLDLATRGESRIATNPGAGDCTNWELVGDRLYLVDRGPDGRQSVYLSRPDGRSEVTVANVRVPVGSGGISVSPDGRTVIYAQTDRRDGDLVVVAPKR